MHSTSSASPPEYLVEQLSNHHDRAAFTCGVEALDRYLHHQAGQDARKGVACVYVLTSVQRPRDILGFYTLSSAVIALNDLPPEMGKRLPRYPHLPATLLGRLAVSNLHKGKGIGEQLLTEALTLSLGQSRRIASAMVVVDAKDESARRFYQRYGFLRLADSPRRLFIPMKTIEGLAARRS